MRQICFLALFIFILTACNSKVIEEELIGGEWIATAGYEDGEIIGQPNCEPFEEGIEFKNEGIVYNRSYEEDVEYVLNDKGPEIIFIISDIGIYRYQIKMIGENKMAIEGFSLGSKGHSCYLERR